MRGGPFKIRRDSTYDSALTKQCISSILVSLLRKWQSGYVTGLKPAQGGSIPPFLVNGLLALEQKRAPQMCDREGGIREAIRYWLR